MDDATQPTDADRRLVAAVAGWLSMPGSERLSQELARAVAQGMGVPHSAADWLRRIREVAKGEAA